MRGRARLAMILVCTMVLASTSAVLAGSVTIGANFPGKDFNQSTFRPPDTMGAVGQNHIVELINGEYTVYNKTGTQLQSSSLNQFWNNAGVAYDGAFTFDPRVVYDSTAGRYYAVAVDNGRAANNYLAAVSNSSDPTAGWTGFKIDSDTDDSNWADFPMLGFDADAVYVTANMFDLTGGVNHTTSLLVLPKADLLIGSVANRTLFEDRTPSDTGFSPQPVINYDGGGLTTSGGILLSAYNVGAGWLKTTTITGAVNSPSLNPVGGFIVVPTDSSPVDADQPGGKQNIDTGGTRFSGNAVLQGGYIWAVNTVDIGGRSATRWYRIDPNTGVAVETGLISDPSLAYYYPSIAVNGNGDVVIGFSGSDANTFVSTYAAVGHFDGTSTTFAAPLLLKSGNSDYQILDTASPPRNRWGDYSATVFDPADSSHFWTFQEFVLSADNWGVQITEIIIDHSSGGVVPLPAAAWMGLGLMGVLALGRRLRKRP